MSSETKRKSERKVLPRISDAEWTVLKAVWQLKTPTAREVVEKLKDESDWKPKTIHTLLSRLVHKGALSAQKPGREYVFKPLVAERDCRLRPPADRSWRKCLTGRSRLSWLCFMERKKLTRKEIDELKSILEEKKP